MRNKERNYGGKLFFFVSEARARYILRRANCVQNFLVIKNPIETYLVRETFSLRANKFRAVIPVPWWLKIQCCIV